MQVPPSPGAGPGWLAAAYSTGTKGPRRHLSTSSSDAVCGWPCGSRSAVRPTRRCYGYITRTLTTASIGSAACLALRMQVRKVAINSRYSALPGGAACHPLGHDSTRKLTTWPPAPPEEDHPPWQPLFRQQHTPDEERTPP